MFDLLNRRAFLTAAGLLCGTTALPSAKAAAQAAGATGTGTVNSVDAAQRKLNMTHGPIPELKWPAMTMDFTVSPKVDLSKVQKGAKVQFTLGKGPGGYQVEAVAPAQ
jgi:Cu/Ag efflux protein CusF